MKKTVALLFVILLIVALCGCNSFQISGLDSFNESDCCFGLNDMLMPEGHAFLSTYPYEQGDYQYWRNNYGQAQAKTFIRLQYSKSVYEQAKSACHDYFTFSSNKYNYENFVFSVVNIADGDTTINVSFPGFRMFGYNDDTCSLIFIGYLNDSDTDNQITTSNFADFFSNQFGRYLEK